MEPAVKLNKNRKEPLPPPPEWPSWLTREEVERLPPRAQQEVEEVLVPAYRKLVREKEDPLEQAAGEKFLYLGWLELVRVARMSGEHGRPASWLSLSGDVHVEREIDRYLQLGGERLRVGGFLVRLKRFMHNAQSEASHSGRAKGYSPPHLLPPFIPKMPEATSVIAPTPQTTDSDPLLPAPAPSQPSPTAE
jgi:hypothetical protein